MKTTEEKLDEILYLLKSGKKKKRGFFSRLLKLIGIIAVVAGVVYGLYRFFSPDYLDDFEEDFNEDFEESFQKEYAKAHKIS
ncbi:MAG: hypothetical protein IKE58_06695 [Blautia sp.]|nr:hypothetical protein [Blautia sp.]